MGKNRTQQLFTTESKRYNKDKNKLEKSENKREYGLI